MSNELIINLFRYYAKFAPKSVLEKLFIQPAASRFTGYDQLHAEAMALPAANELPDLDTFIVSINENFLSERIKNASKFILFVEYGAFSLDYTVPEGVTEQIAVSVAHNFSDTNNDSVNELLLMNKCFELLDTILQTMVADQNELDFCDGSLADPPIKVQAIDPASFYGCGGWVAIFKKTNTILA